MKPDADPVITKVRLVKRGRLLVAVPASPLPQLSQAVVRSVLEAGRR